METAAFTDCGWPCVKDHGLFHCILTTVVWEIHNSLVPDGGILEPGGRFKAAKLKSQGLLFMQLEELMCSWSHSERSS